VREVCSPSCDVAELLESEYEEVVSVAVVDVGAAAVGAICCAYAEPHNAMRVTALSERSVKRVVSRVFMASSFNQQSDRASTPAKWQACVSSARPRPGSACLRQRGSGGEKE